MKFSVFHQLSRIFWKYFTNDFWLRGWNLREYTFPFRDGYLWPGFRSISVFSNVWKGRKFIFHVEKHHLFRLHTHLNNAKLFIVNFILNEVILGINWDKKPMFQKRKMRSVQRHVTWCLTDEWNVLDIGKCNFIPLGASFVSRYPSGCDWVTPFNIFE